ncbi:leukotriene A-4 hydrolase/aminopeptidase [Pontibacter ummariensis]|uniref:Aminopeptidase N n=2 Tax=Pontibacter ummariensis TaxID=1610492 RepID=A0A239FN91_9BACT|nr:leukotriene A-4 hydrolase/aminopeptidase [Pontibacter ummariensis]SNS57712.1 leukotriene A-4 hydrolase/aminopeptidase [Pontibacter ummariensis]
MTQAQSDLAMAAADAHSYAKPTEAVARHLDLDLDVNFDQKILSGTAAYQIENLTGTDQIIFDTRDLEIEKVFLGEEMEETTFRLGDSKEYLGRPLIVDIKPDTKKVTIQYKTSPNAAALQWLNPQQTAGKKDPFLFTQSQAILARTWIPIQDSPGIRITYNAQVKVPENLLAVMSAENPVEKNNTGVYTFEMEQPIPSYLMALSVGDLVFRQVGPQTGIYAEPATIEAAAYEFAELDKMLEAAEKLYGKYRWDRYDLLVLPPSFPFGGMENPRLTFVTPTVLAKDRSLTSLIAHELAHSWSGNLVTNATWNDFWLNEGFTVYFERRIMEELYGKEYADMLQVLGYQDLTNTLNDLGPGSADTRLKLDLEGRDPDEGLTDIAYEKGNFFLRNIERAVGRERFDAFLNKYFSTFAFQSTNTDKFLDFLRSELIQGDEALAKKINIEGWVYSPGLPEDFQKPTSARFAQVEEAFQSWISGKPAAQLDTKDWSSHEWLHFIRMLPESMTQQQMAELDRAFNFTNSGNSEVLAAWFLHAIRNNYTTADQALEAFLTKVGRRKFLVPIYKALIATPEGKKKALAIYAKARPNYHAVSTVTLDELLK